MALGQTAHGYTISCCPSINLLADDGSRFDEKCGMSDILFNGWESLLKNLVLTVCGYLSIISMLRVSGKRTLTKMNAFDFVITIALGSALATTALNKDISLANGVLVFALLIFMQMGLTWLASRNNSIRNLITANPELLAYKGELKLSSMKKCRITKDELYAALRQKGFSELTQVSAVVLENSGKISVLAGTEINDTD